MPEPIVAPALVAGALLTASDSLLAPWGADSSALLWGVGGGLAKLISQSDLTKGKALLLIGVSSLFAAAFGQLVIHLVKDWLDVTATLLVAPVHFSLGYGAQTLLPLIPEMLTALWKAVIETAAGRINKEK